MNASAPAHSSSDKTRKRYDRVAPIYDWVEALPERFAIRNWRQMLWDRVEGPRVLEIGVGTGKNIPFYPAEMQITAIDLSPRMLERARHRAEAERSSVTLQLADAQHLPFADETFDSVVGAFVFCSVPDPVRGMREAARVLKRDGQFILLEHVLTDYPGMRQTMRLLNPLLVRMTGANYDRDTVSNVEQAGFEEMRVRSLWLDIVRLIEARASRSQGERALESSER